MPSATSRTRICGSAPSCRLRQPSFQNREPLSDQRTLVPVSSTSSASAKDDLPLPLRPMTSVSPGPGRSFRALSGPMPRKPRTPIVSR